MTAEPWVPEAPEPFEEVERPDDVGFDPWDYDLPELLGAWQAQGITSPDEATEIEF